VQIRNDWVNISPAQLTSVTHSHFSASEHHHRLHLDMFRGISWRWQTSTSAAPWRPGAMCLWQSWTQKFKTKHVKRVENITPCSLFPKV